MNRILLSTPRSVLGNLLSSFQALPVCSMFTWNSSKTAITAAASAGLFGMGAIFYFYYYNDDSRISSKKHLRPIEILYHEHENFATLRKNWQIVSTWPPKSIKTEVISRSKRLSKIHIPALSARWDSHVQAGGTCILPDAIIIAYVFTCQWLRDFFTTILKTLNSIIFVFWQQQGVSKEIFRRWTIWLVMQNDS